MRLLVTGGTGFLGKPFVERCVQAGHEIVLLGRTPSDNAQVMSIIADISDKTTLESVKEKVGDIDILVHLAALVPKTPAEDVAEDMARVNVQGTVNLLETFGKMAKVIVYGSTAEVYGLPSVDGPINESQLPHPPSNYGASKLSGEYFANIFSARNEVPVISLRFSVMYGAPDDIARAIPNFIKKAVRNEPLELFGGEDLRDYLHVDDAVESIVCALKATKTATYNVGSGKATSIKDTAQAIVAAAKSQSTLKILPPQKKPADLVFDITAIQKDIGYKPRHIFPEGMELQIESYKQKT